MAKISRATNFKRTVIKQMKRGKTGRIQRSIFARQNRFYWMMGLFFTLFISFVLYFDFATFYRENWPAGRTYIARVDFTCKDVDATEEDRELQASVVPPVYLKEEQDVWLSKSLSSFDRFVALVRKDSSEFDVSRNDWNQNYQGRFPEELARIVLENNQLYEAFRANVEAILKEAHTFGVIDRSKLEHKDGYIIISLEGLENEDKTPIGNLIDRKDLIEHLADDLTKTFNKKMTEPLIELVRKRLKPSIEKRDKLTESYRDRIRQEVEYLYKDVLDGEVIVKEGETITRGIAETLDAEQTAYTASLTNAQKLKMYSGNVLFTAVFIIIVAMYMTFFETDTSLPRGKLFLYFVLMMSYLIVAKLLSFLGFPANAVPVIFIGMVSAIIMNLRFAIMIVFVLSLVTGNIFKADIFYTIALFASGGVGIFFCSYIRRRIQIIKGGVIGGLVNAIIIYGVSFARNLEFESFMLVGLAGFASGLISGIVLVGVLPLIEYIFDTTTDVRLLELSDQGHPLLRNLFLTASGTYTHSLSVGNLAESAASEIGANALLARVASYYHDIGKIFKPEYFIENQNMGGNKHDRLRPGLSSLILASHTKDGVDLGQEYHLPQRLLDIILEHHGTGKIAYFLQKAQAMAGDRERVEEEFFRYSGPKPQSKESGIVLMADSIEAASRTLTNPSPSSIRKIVERIIRGKIDDGQLDDTGLTLVELAKIRESFIQVLYGIFHARIEYPEEKNAR